MREYKLIKAQPYLCVCAALQSVLLRHGYELDQLEIAKQLGVTIPVSAIDNTTLQYQNLSFSDEEKELGTHLGRRTLNDFFKQNSIDLRETFVTKSEIGEFNFESILSSIDESFDALIFFDYGTLFNEIQNKGVGHCGLFVTIKESDLIYADPGPRRFGLNKVSIDNNYFNDSYQGIPIGGYNKLINGLLEGVDTKTGIDFFTSEYHDWRKYADKLVYTGRIDEYFGSRFGELNWRTVSFKSRVEDTPNYQGNAVVNYTSHDVPYTRVIEHKHFESFGQAVYDNPKTVISEEYSTEYKPGMEPYYPVNDKQNSELYAKYKELADKEENVIFGGRLAEYKYYDMAPIIEKVLEKF